MLRRVNLFDPRGARRRGAVNRGTVSSLVGDTGRALDVAFRDVRTRAAGQLSTIRSWIAHMEPIDHEVAKRVAGNVWTRARQPGAMRIGGALAVVALGLLVRRLSTRPAASTIGRDAITIQKMVNVAAPVHEVFRFWTRHENWSRVLPHVREVEEIALDRHRWAIGGPEGPIEWITVITKFGTDRVIEWETVPEAVVEHAGSIRFRENRDGTTHLDITMSYVPPAGAVGNAVVALFGGDRKTLMNEELARFKSLLAREPPSTSG